MQAHVLLATALVCLSSVPCATGQAFVDVTEQVGVNSIHTAWIDLGGGLAWFDFDGDGDDDLYTTGGMEEDRLYMNNSDGTFTVVPDPVIAYETSIRTTTGVVTGDLDNDGFREILVTTTNAGIGVNMQRNLLFYNNGDGTFQEIGESAGLDALAKATASNLVDINQDGLLDIFIGNYVSQNGLLTDEQGNIIGFSHTCYPDELYLNNGDLTFTLMQDDWWDENTGCTLASIGIDLDHNGSTELMVINDFGEWVVPNRVYQLAPEGLALQDIAPEKGLDIGIYGMGVAAADVNQDLELDYYVTNLGSNALLIHQADGTFSEHAEDLGVSSEFAGDGLAVGWGTFFFDFNNDSWPDLYVCNGYIAAADWLDNDFYQNNEFYRNLQGSGFQLLEEPIVPDNHYRSRGGAWSDFNEDGRPDFAVANLFTGFEVSPERFRVYQNIYDSGNDFLKVNLRGVTCNRDAFGSRVEVFTKNGVFMQALHSGSSHNSQNTSTLHFGLGPAAVIDSMLVHWPTGDTQPVYGLNPSSKSLVVQDTTSAVTDSIHYENWIVSLPARDGYLEMDFDKSLVVQADLPHDALQFASVFPNPVSSALSMQLRLKAAAPLSLDLFDLSGRLVHHLWAGPLPEGRSELVFDRPCHVPSGSFLLRATLGGATRTWRLHFADL